MANTEYFLEECKLIKDLNNKKVNLVYLIGEELVKNNLNLVHAVGKGSKNPPIAISLEYNGNIEE